MSNKVFIGIIVVLLAGLFGIFAFQKKGEAPASERPGIAQPDEGRKHVEVGAKEYGGPEPPTSGDHANPLPWGFNAQEIQDINVIHNMEHGGIYVSYRPDLSVDQIAKIKALFSEPYSRKDFQASKAIIAPRSANESPIVMSSWTRSLKLDSFDEEKMVDFYRRNIGQSPEPNVP